MTTLFPTQPQTMTLRDYQREAVVQTYEWLRQNEGHPLIVIPTGGGKTIPLATICRDVVETWHGRVLVLAHVKELLEQAVEKIAAIAPGLDVGVYSAGLGSKKIGRAVTVAQIQSVYRHAEKLGPINICIIDECHLMPDEGDGMYRTLIAGLLAINPNMRVIGLTATPYRTASGSLVGDGQLFSAISYEVGIKELVARGYLTKLRARSGLRRADTSKITKRAGEFAKDAMQEAMMADGLVSSACHEILELTRDRRSSVLIFASGVEHGKEVARVLSSLAGQEVGWIDGTTLDWDRSKTLARFKARELKYLANANVLTTGFDAPGVDCVVLLRPTMSPGLYYQMVGRGFRIAPGKEDCLVLDYGENVIRHGPVDAIRLKHEEDANGGGGGEPPAKECASCHALVHAGFSVCPECGEAFPAREKREYTHQPRAGAEGILTGEKTYETIEVTDTAFYVHAKRGASDDAPKTMRVEYFHGYQCVFREFVCVEHDGYALTKAKQWWLQHSNDPFPESAAVAVAIAENGGVAETTEITICKTAGKDWPEISDRKLGPVPARMGSEEDIEYTPPTQAEIDEMECPF